MSHFLNSPAFSGNPTAPTPALGDNSTSLSTTAFVKGQGYLTANQAITLTGDVTGTGTTSIAATLAASGVVAGTYTKVTVDAKGRVTVGAALASADITTALGYTPLNRAGDTATNLLLAADPVAALGAATKQYVDNMAQGIDAKNSVRCATTVNLAALTGLLAVDGITTVAGDRVLVKNQTTPAQNGVYVASAAAWVRAIDQDTWAEIPSAFVWVETGTVNADTGWICTADQGGTLNTTAITWSQFSGSGVVTAGVGLTKVGNVISLALVTASRALVSDGTGLLAASAVTATELGYLTGVTSGIQAQINLRAPLASPALTGVPTAPTAAVGTNTTQLATTAFVLTAVSGPNMTPIATLAANTTLDGTQGTILANAAAAGFTITLPAAPATGFCYTIKKIDATANGVIISGNGRTIDGAASFTLNGQWQSINIQHDGTSWFVF